MSDEENQESHGEGQEDESEGGEEKFGESGLNHREN